MPLGTSTSSRRVWGGVAGTALVVVVTVVLLPFRDDVTSATPGLILVLSHGGGAYPYLAGRFDIMHRRMDRAAQGDVAADTPSAYASRMAYDSIVHAPKALRFLIDVAGLDKVLLGTDYSFPPADMEPLALLRAAQLSKGEIAAIADDNPRRVFARLG